MPPDLPSSRDEMTPFEIMEFQYDAIFEQCKVCRGTGELEGFGGRIMPCVDCDGKG